MSLLLICQILYLVDEVISYWLLGKKIWWAWLIKLGGIIPLTAINIMAHLTIFHVLNVFFVSIYIINIFRWRKNGKH